MKIDHIHIDYKGYSIIIIMTQRRSEIIYMYSISDAGGNKFIELSSGSIYLKNCIDEAQDVIDSYLMFHSSKEK